MTENRDIYTYPLNVQSAAEAFNTILWRVGVAAGILERGQKDAIVDVDALVEEVEILLHAGAAYSATVDAVEAYEKGQDKDGDLMVQAGDDMLLALQELAKFKAAKRA